MARMPVRARRRAQGQGADLKAAAIVADHRTQPIQMQLFPGARQAITTAPVPASTTSPQLTPACAYAACDSSA